MDFLMCSLLPWGGNLDRSLAINLDSSRGQLWNLYECIECEYHRPKLHLTGDWFDYF